MARATKVNLEEQAKEIESVQEPINEESEKPAVTDSWKEMVTLFIPRANYGDSKRTEMFSVNNVAWNVIWDGSKQEMPRPIAEIVQAVLADRYAEEDAVSNLPQNAVNPNPGVEGRNF